MSFTPLQFLIFLPVVFLLYHAAARYFSSSWLLLLIASYVFYAATNVAYLPWVLAVVTLISFVSGRLMGKVEKEGLKLLFLWLGVGGNCLILVGLKYLSFIITNLNRLVIFSGIPAHIPEVPFFASIAVSFFVFQAISYLLDISLGLLEPEQHLGHYALSMAFFPKLLQGPIERSGDLLPQLKAPYLFDYDNIRAGILLFTWGFFKKVVIADRLGLFVDRVYGNVYTFSGLPLLLATWLYAFQLYFDFFGYTDMALGCARLFNIRLTQNFSSPYLATSVADFWRRWHISFSRWILDYIFKPLQMQWRNWGIRGTSVALIITFLISGVWHGAKWGFIIWGLLHGLFLCCSLYWKPYQKRLYRWLGVEKTPLLRLWQTFVTFQMVSFAWIFFRADSLPDARYIITHIFGDGWRPSGNMGDFVQKNLFLMQSTRETYVAVLCMLFVTIVGMVSHRTGNRDLSQILTDRPIFLRWGIYYSLLLGIIMLGVFNRSNFIYFKF